MSGQLHTAQKEAKFRKKLRFWSWVLRDLVSRYQRFLIVGFVVGLTAMLVIGRVAPILLTSILRKTERVGIIGDYSPTNIPLVIQNQLSVGLTRIAQDGSTTQGVAEKWSIEEDGKQFTFTLSPQYWHSGKQLKAQDINYNIQGVTFEAVDEKTVRVMLPEAYSPFPTLVSKPLLGVGLQGVGEYSVSNLQLKGDRIDSITLKPKDVQKSKIEYRFFRTEALAILAFKRGDIDRIDEISTPQIFQNWRNVSILGNVNYGRIVGLFLNVKNQELSDRSFRQLLAISTPEFAGEELAISPISKTSWAYNDKVKQYIFDEVQAKKLLETSKIEKDFPGLTISTFPQYVDQAQKIAEIWTSIGIPTKIKIENIVGKDYQILLSAQDIPPDPDQYPFWHSQQIETNITNYQNLKVDKLLEDGRRTVDQEKRKKIYADFQRTLVEDVPVIFLYYPKTYTIVRK